jgi:hypothetical protein
MSVYKTRQTMANEFGIDRITFVKEVQSHGIELEPRKLISPAKQDEIYAKMGRPDGGGVRRHP